MQIELNLLFEIVFVALLVKLVVGQWYPPVQKSIQAIFVCGIGSAAGWFLNDDLGSLGINSKFTKKK